MVSITQSLCGLGESAVGILKRNAVHYVLVGHVMSLTVGKNVTRTYMQTQHRPDNTLD